MDLDKIITAAQADKAAWEQNARTKAEESDRARQREVDRLTTILHLTVLPALESCRQKLTDGGVECSLTNGQDSVTKELRHGLTLDWCGAAHSLVFTSNSSKCAIAVQSAGPGLDSQPISGNLATMKPGQVEGFLETFVSRALGWLPGRR